MVWKKGLKVMKFKEICPVCGSDTLDGICENCNPEEWDQEFVDQGGWM